MLEDETCAHAYVHVEVPLHRSLLCSTGQDNLIFFLFIYSIILSLFSRTTEGNTCVAGYVSIFFCVFFFDFVSGCFYILIRLWEFRSTFICVSVCFFLFMLYLRLNVFSAVVLHSRNIVRSFFCSESME